MGEEGKREGADDLFEDLDKFFAPIRDVEWPEPDEPAPPTPASTPEEHVEVHPAAPGPEHAVDEEGPEEADVGGERDGAWYETESMEPIVDEQGEPEVPEQAIVVPTAEVPGQSDLFEHEEEDEAERPVSVTEAEMEEPSEAELEAAAEHFAESIRSEEPPIVIENEAIGAAGEQAEAEGDAGGPAPEEVEADILSDLDEATAARTVKVGAEGLGGPSWQEPTSVEVGADLDRRGERDVPAAFITGLLLAVVAVLALLAGKPWFAAVAAIVVLIAQGELFGVMHSAHHQPATAVGLATGVLVLWGSYDGGESAVIAMFSLGVMATFLWYMAVPAIHRKDALLNIGLTVFNIAYIPLLGSFLLLTLALGRGDDGTALVVTVIGLTFVYDTVAFLAGATFGGSSIQRSLAPDTSPKKSWEGLIIATIVTVIVSMALVPSFVAPFEDKRLESLVLALVVSAAATFGDLAESLIKRDLDLKDMGNILPGHGGVLDRIDSLLFTAPSAYLLFRVFFG